MIQNGLNQYPMSAIELNFKPRKQQQQILEFVKDSINQDKKFIMIDAPTGVGKSYAAIMISEWYRTEVNKSAKVDILTNSKILQDQYIKDFNFIADLKGKTNYWCRGQNMTCGDAEMLGKVTKQQCKICPYKMAKTAWIRKPLSLTNFHLITSYSMYSDEFLQERRSKLLIVDEAHGFEEVFCDFVSSVFSKRALAQFDIWDSQMESTLEGIQNIYDLADYVKSDIVPKLDQKIKMWLEEANSKRIRSKKMDLVKKANHADKAMCKYNRLVKDRENFEKNWIFEKSIDSYGNTKILVEPIWASIYLQEYFWSKYDHVIFMSGTILNKDLFSKLMGIDSTGVSYLALPCPFDAKNRPIIYLKFGKMSYYDKKETFNRSIPIIERIIEKNKEVKGIIHTSNYELSTWIQTSIKDSRLIFHDSDTREKSLTQHISSEYSTIIVSPSMITGIDLKDDLSRFQIILKVPFPNLTSMKIKKRLESNPEWYNWKTLVDILQAYGRSIRNEKDWAETYILDECFDQILNNNVPQYFKEALKIKKLPKK